MYLVRGQRRRVSALRRGAGLVLRAADLHGAAAAAAAVQAGRRTLRGEAKKTTRPTMLGCTTLGSLSELPPLGVVVFFYFFSPRPK